MEAWFSSLVVLIGLSATAGAQLDLRPVAGTFVGEGTPFPCIRFREGEVLVRYLPPTGWRFEELAGGCQFQPKGLAQATGSMRVAARVEGQPVAERVRELLAAGLPREATDILSVADSLPQVRIDRWDSTQAQVVYELYGQTFRSALVLVPLEREEIQIRFTCRVADFEKAYAPFFESLGTITWNPPDERAAGGRPSLSGGSSQKR